MKVSLAVASLAVYFSSIAFAHGKPIDMTTASVTEGIAQFKKDHPEHIEHFQGIKAWPVGTTIELKIYLPDNASVGYTCGHDEAAMGKLKCTMKM